MAVAAGVVSERPHGRSTPGGIGLPQTGLLCLTKLQEQVELLGEEFVICPCVQSEERKGLAERTTADDKLGAPSRNQVEGRELLEESYRVGGAQYRYRARQSNLAGARRCCRKYDRRCGIEEFGAMMFARCRIRRARPCRRPLLPQEDRPCGRSPKGAFPPSDQEGSRQNCRYQFP